MAIEWLEVRLYLDEDVSPDLARALRQRGFDVISAHEVGNLSISDSEQLEYAASQGRAILTYNIGDYAVLCEEWHTQSREHYGIIVSQQFSKRQFGELLRRVLWFLNAFTAEDVYNNYLYLSP